MGAEAPPTTLVPRLLGADHQYCYPDLGPGPSDSSRLGSGCLAVQRLVEGQLRKRRGSSMRTYAVKVFLRFEAVLESLYR